MSSSEIWLRDYETAKQLADDTLAMIQVRTSDLLPPSLFAVSHDAAHLAMQRCVTSCLTFLGISSGPTSCSSDAASIQERNIKFPHGGQEASRVTAAARKKLGSLGALVDNMRGDVEAASSDSM